MRVVIKDTTMQLYFLCLNEEDHPIWVERAQKARQYTDTSEVAQALVQLEKITNRRMRVEKVT